MPTTTETREVEMWRKLAEMASDELRIATNAHRKAVSDLLGEQAERVSAERRALQMGNENIVLRLYLARHSREALAAAEREIAERRTPDVGALLHAMRPTKGDRCSAD